MHPLFSGFESRRPGIYRRRAEFALDAEQAVILHRAFAARGCARLDLPGVQRHGEIGNRAVLALTGTV